MPRYIVDDFQQQLSSFSPGFWFFDGKRFWLDTQAQSLFQTEKSTLSLDAFLSGIDAKGAAFLERFFSSLHEEILTLKFSVTRRKKKNILMQGSILARGEDGHVSSCSGYCIELRTLFSIPRMLHSHELGIWEWNGISGECHFCEDYRAMLGYGPDEAFPETIEEWMTLVHPEDMDAVDFQK